MKVRELICEVPINEMEWYTIELLRDDSIKNTKAYHLDIWYEDDDTLDSRKLVGGTSLYHEVPGEITYLITRTQAFKTFSIVVSELLALVHVKRDPKHPLLTMINESDIIEEARKELEDLWYIVIE